jgi:hypothetical protein
LPALPVSAPRAKTLLVLPDIEHLQLRLLGGEAIISYESFRMTPAALEDCQGWTVHHLDRQERRTEIGHFRFRAPTLEFQWHADSHVAVADQLRNTMLELVADERCALVALREVTPVEPLLISGGSGLRNVILHIDSLPNVAQLRLDVAASTGAQAFSRMFADAAAGPEQPLSIDLGVAAMDYPLEVTLSFLVPRASSGVVHLQYEVRYRSHYAPLLELSPSNVARDVQLTRSMIQQSEELAHLAHLEATLEYFTQLSEIVSGQSELKLHFRIVLPLGESQVVLAQTARP